MTLLPSGEMATASRLPGNANGSAFGGTNENLMTGGDATGLITSQTIRPAIVPPHSVRQLSTPLATRHLTSSRQVNSHVSGTSAGT